MPRNTARIIREKITSLAENPYMPNNTRKLEDRQEYRLRVGDWRVIYALHDELLIVEIIRVKPRGEAYR